MGSREIAALGFPVVLVAPADRNALGGQAKFGQVLLAALRRLGPVRHVQIPLESEVRGWRRIAASIGLARTLIGAIQRCDSPPVVHVFSPCNRSGFYEKLVLVALARLLGSTAILNFRNAFDHWFENWSGVEKTVIRRILGEQWVLCQYRGLADYLVESGLVPAERVGVMPNGMEPGEMKALESLACRRAKNQALRVVFLGSVVPRKGIESLIEAAGRARATVGPPGLEVHVFGRARDRAYADALSSLIQSSCPGVVRLMGPVGEGEKLSVLEGADAFVLPSEAEGFPNALLEAMAAGVPPIVARAGAMPEMVESPLHGWVFEAGDVEGLAACLIELATDEARRWQISTHIRATVAERYGIEQVVAALTDFYARAHAYPARAGCQ
jgi:glycosyltransferase involved in cell wall biosynthesis